MILEEKNVDAPLMHSAGEELYSALDNPFIGVLGEVEASTSWVAVSIQLDPSPVDCNPSSFLLVLFVQWHPSLTELSTTMIPCVVRQVAIRSHFRFTSGHSTIHLLRPSSSGTELHTQTRGGERSAEARVSRTRRAARSTCASGRGGGRGTFESRGRKASMRDVT